MIYKLHIVSPCHSLYMDKGKQSKFTFTASFCQCDDFGVDISTYSITDILVKNLFGFTYFYNNQIISAGI
jgi:hypothetical protein